MYIVCVCVNTVQPKKYAHALCFVISFRVWMLVGLPTDFKVTLLAFGKACDCHNTNAITLKDIYNFDGLVQYCSISIANELEIPQSCTKPSS